MVGFLGIYYYISMRERHGIAYSFLGYIIVKAYFNYIFSCIHNTYLGFIIYNYEKRIFPCIIILTIYYYISMRVGYVLVFILEIYNYNSMFFCILTNTYRIYYYSIYTVQYNTVQYTVQYESRIFPCVLTFRI